jgi:ribosomal protein S18 acetylase RimI-like enzyme
MDLLVRPARPEDPCVPLLFESAKPYYVAYAGGERRAVAILSAIFARPGHAASFDCTHVAVAGNGDIAGVLAGFPVDDGDRRARRFVALTLPRIRPWSWPATYRHLRAAEGVSPSLPDDVYYVDALAVDARYRRRGVATRLLRHAEQEAARAGLPAVALDTGLQNAAARALYEAQGYSEREVCHAPDARTARALGGPGFVGYLKAV